MILHENKKEFTEAVQAAGDFLKVTPFFIEKIKILKLIFITCLIQIHLYYFCTK